jgi:protein-tyrosine phosphatase
MGYVDLHAHFLPGIDDGSPDLTTSLAMLRALAELGYEQVSATPHQYEGRFLPERAAIDAACATVRQEAERARVGLGIALAAENMWDGTFLGRWADASFPRYERTPSFLFELRPNDVPLGFEQSLFQLQVRGFRPVMAHPERYVAFWGDAGETRLATVAERGCALLVDLPALAGYHGSKQQKAARRLVERRLAHAAATDCHNPDDVAQAAEGIDWIRRKMGLAEVTRLCEENPRRILSGLPPE